nr:actin cytoskeleton-regulatory complex pan-like protein [Fagopyrum tataricum]
MPIHHKRRGFGVEAKVQPMSPCSVNGPVNGYTCEPQASLKFSNYAMEGATKWDPIRPEKNEEPGSFQLYDKNQNGGPMVSALQEELEQAQRRIEELESERRSSKKKLKQFLVKLSEERTAWRSREHEKVRAIISDVKSDLTRERKNCQRLEIVNSKMVNELAEAKLVMKRYMQDFEKERKNRELVEEVCDELAKEIGEDKAEVEELKAECMKIREEVDDERKMLQMAEVWREERVQMKLIDAKVTLEAKYSQMNKLIVDLQQFLGSNSGTLDPREIKEAELLQQAANSVKIQDLKEFTYEPPKSGDIFSIFEEMGMGETSEHNMSPDKVYGDVDDDEDGSGWETVSHADDQGSSFSPEGSLVSLNKAAVKRDSNVSGSGTEWERNRGDETPMTETSEVCSVRSKHLRKMSSISKLWKSLPNNGDDYKIISMDGRLSNAGGYTPSDLPGHWSSPDAANPQMGRGMKGCIDWPRGQKNSLKAKLLEARVESQKIQLRQVLKQKI